MDPKDVNLGMLSDWITGEELAIILSGNGEAIFFIEDGEVKCEVDEYDDF